MTIDWTIGAGAIIVMILSYAASWVTFRIKMALAEKRAQEAFDIAKQARDQLARLQIEIAKDYVSAEKLNNEIVRLERVIEKLNTSVTELAKDMRGMGEKLTTQIVEALKGRASR